MSENPIEDALNFAYAKHIVDGEEPPDWTPEFVLSQARAFCDEIRAIEVIIRNALDGGDVKMLARAAAQMQFASIRQFGMMSSMVTFTAGQIITEGPGPDQVEKKGKYENLFEALIKLDMVGGDVDGGRSAARMTDMMQEWVSDSQDGFMYLMSSALRDAGWADTDLLRYVNTETPEFNAGLLEDLDEELLKMFNNSDDDEGGK